MKGESKIELVEAYAPEVLLLILLREGVKAYTISPLKLMILTAEVNRLTDEGFTLINDEPKEGADNKMVCFLHPKSTNGVLIELVMEKPSSSTKEEV